MTNQSYIMELLLILPTVSIISLLFIENEQTIKNFSIFMGFLIFIVSLPLWILFNKSTPDFQFLVKFEWISQLNLYFFLGIDGISLFFIILTTFLIPICMLISYETVTKNIREYFILFFLLELCLIISFSVLDLLIFYIFFESVLIPMFFIIGIWGSESRKIKASYLFFMYTLAGSLFMFIAIIHLFLTVGSTDYLILYYAELKLDYEKLYWLAFFISFAVKIPILPFHLWLPEAHVEAPTAGSVLLAGLLLKLGSYGMLRFLLPLFPHASIYYTPYVVTLCLVSMILASFSATRQTDMKRIIAYASVAHMSFIVLGIFSSSDEGIEGSIIAMISHGLVSSALFFSIGCIYDRYHSRNILYYGGLVQTMPLFCIALFIYILANMATPGTSSFVGEILILIGVYMENSSSAVLSTVGMFLGGVYSLLFYNRVCFGQMPVEYMHVYYDLTYREFVIHVTLLITILVMGIYPNIFLSCLHATVTQMVVHCHWFVYLY